ncbi:MAG: GvpL/GvpF family gas vesicle protein [Ignavibacteria bacterium]|jgi:hypothetical protein
MEKEGKYIYCIIDSEQERNYGPIGIGGRNDEVLTIGYKDLSMVVSNHPLNKFVVDRESMLAHEKVVEEVMKDSYSVLPVRYGTVAANAEEVRNFLYRRYSEFKDALRDMKYKIELDVKGYWKNMPLIFDEIVKENEEIDKAKDEISNGKSKLNIENKRHIGMLVKNALQKKKEEEAESIIAHFKYTYIDCKLNNTIIDEMFLNAAFLIDIGKEKEFDNIMDDISEIYKGRIRFAYTGPLPVYNFVNIVVHQEKWEV